jgi:hypothetical protein
MAWMIDGWKIGGMILRGENGRTWRNPSQCHIVRDVSHMKCPRIKPRPRRLEVSKCLNHGKVQVPK